jgi:hypothetical protein
MGGFVDNWGINSYYVMLKFVSSTLMEERYPHIHKPIFTLQLISAERFVTLMRHTKIWESDRLL